MIEPPDIARNGFKAAGIADYSITQVKLMILTVATSYGEELKRSNIYVYITLTLANGKLLLSVIRLALAGCFRK